jgi:non-canonical (house-cleaning) NTP pyrophosphatase
MDIYLTSTNKDKLNASKNILTKFNNSNIICIESDSKIMGGQPYGLEETKLGCENRTKHFSNNENFISIENGFIKETETIWYDIAYIYIRINGKIYNGWTEKRYFPKYLFNNTPKLIEYFETYSITRFNQLNNCVIEILNE